MDTAMEKAASRLGGAKPLKKRMRMHIDQLDDDSFLVEHHKDGMEKPERFTHRNLKGLHEHLDKHWGDVKGASEKSPKLPTRPVKPEKDTYDPEEAK